MAHLLATSHLSQLSVEGHATQDKVFKLHVKFIWQQPAELSGYNPYVGLQTEHIFVASHLSQFKVDEQATHLTLAIWLQVKPVWQQPSELIGREKKPDVQVLHTFEVSHRSQLRVDGQEKHDELTLFQVNPDRQHPGDELGCKL